MHPGGSSWGWQSDYINALKIKHLKNTLIPTFDLAVWLFRSYQWDEKIQTQEIFTQFFKEFHIKNEELELFDLTSPIIAAHWLQPQVITGNALIDIIDSPPVSVTEGASLKALKLTGIGPALQIEFKPAPRLNLITGDNGLGKTFLLECAWWALTGTWVGYPARPRRDTAKNVPGITFQIGKDHQQGKIQTVKYDYLLVWAWQSHVKTAETMRREPEQSIVLLIDEMEAHLHPLWQRVIVPSLMRVVHELTSQVQVQMIVATHSPLVLASVESLFKEESDGLFHLNLENGLVQLDELPFLKRGRVDQWLTSDIFGLAQPRSIDAEKTIEVANKLQLTKNPPQEEVQKVSDKLVKVLAPDDEFWPLWTYFAKQRGVRFDAR